MLLQAVSIWSPYASGNGQWIARNLVTGFISAPIEALPETSITDIYFTHERGTYIGWYAWVLASSNYFAPVICGFINDSLGFKWPFFIMGIFAGAAFISLFVFLEESNYDRSASATGEFSGNSSAKEDAENRTAHETNEQQVDTPVVTYGKEKTFVQKMSLKDSKRKFMMHWRAWQSLKFLAWPNIFFAGFSYGTYLIWFNIMNATASIILGDAPYSFKPSIVGLCYLAPMIGVVVGYVGSHGVTSLLALAVKANCDVLQIRIQWSRL